MICSATAVADDHVDQISLRRLPLICSETAVADDHVDQDIR